jgi:hypothetical protein
VAEAFELADEPAAVALGVLLVAALEVELAELVVWDFALEDVVGGDEDRVGDRDCRFRVTSSSFDPCVVGGQVGALGARRRLGGLDQRGV